MGGLSQMKKRMIYHGGKTADARNLRGKYLSFVSALDNSYQGEYIIYDGRRFRCLINPDKTTEEYDQKEISIDFESGMKEGDTFYWERTDSHWIVYLQRLTEEAYFRAQIRRCNYKINDWWVYLRGPVETALIWSQKHSINMNDMNSTILVYVTKTKESMEFFKRLKVIKFDGHNWRVAATDKYSQEGIIEVYLEEYYDNEMEDNVEIPEILEPDKEEPYIEGLSVVEPYSQDLVYKIANYEERGGFIVPASNKIKIKEQSETEITLDVISGKKGSFTLPYYTNGKLVTSLEVQIKSLM